MHRHRSKREQLIRTIATFTIMPVVIVCIATTLVLYMLGWRYNISEQTVAQGGLMQFDSRPSGATVIINGNPISDETAARQDMPAGSHVVRMEHQGYLPWQKSVTVEPGEILWLNYARLIPEDIKVEQVTEYDSLHDALASPYGTERLLLQAAKDEPRFILVEADNGEEVSRQELVIPDDLLGQPAKAEAEAFSLKTWDEKARYVLLTHTYGDKTEWLYMDTENISKSKNITRIAKNNVTNVAFDRRNPEIVYVVIDQQLHLIDLVQNNVSDPIIKNVAAFRQSNDGVITYISQLDKKPDTRTIGYYTPGASRPMKLATVENTDLEHLQAQITEYSGEQYFILRQDEQLSISKIGLHSSDAATTSKLSKTLRFTLPKSAGTMSISDDSRFVIIQKDASFVTYDFELGQLTTTTQVGEAKATPVRWLDNHILWSDRGGVLRTYEFDGENGHEIMPVAPGFDVVLSPDGQYVYAIQKTDDGVALSRARLILP